MVVTLVTLTPCPAENSGGEMHEVFGDIGTGERHARSDISKESLLYC